MKNLLSIFFVFISLSFYAQSLTPEVISTSGGYNENSNASLSWTIGEPVIETFQDTAAILTQGFHQTNLTVVQVEKLDATNINCIVYPNPTTDHLMVKIENFNKEKILLELYDVKGVKLFDKEVSNQITDIDFSNYQAANYYLKVLLSGEKHYTYQIVKTN
ncbi:MAG: T9SS type A sorting domain-containing protein [Bacteroidota bacterium]